MLCASLFFSHFAQTNLAVIRAMPTNSRTRRNHSVRKNVFSFVIDNLDDVTLLFISLTGGVERVNEHTVRRSNTNRLVTLMKWDLPDEPSSCIRLNVGN